MPNVQSLSHEHEAIMTVASDLLHEVSAAQFDLEAIARLRWRLAHQLAVHLAQEDRIVYPRLKRSGDRRLAYLANVFESEMGGLAADYRAYMAAWSAPAITEDPCGFARATHHVMALLERRVMREETELYPLVPNAEPAAIGR